jgi:molecular chaperone GrpE
VKAEYFATGEEAQQIAEEVAYNVATVYPEALTVRSEASEDSASIGTVYSSDELEVVAYDGDWMKVALGDDVYGYVSAYYVGYDTYYATAETLEEEQARLDQQWLDYLAEQEAQEAAAEQAYQDSLAAEQSYTDYSYSEEQAAADAAWEQASYEAQATADAQAEADAQYQEYLDAQAAADEATGQADEQAVIDAAAQAEAEYQEYLAAQAAADAQAQAEAEAQASQQETAQPEEAQNEAAQEETLTPEEQMAKDLEEAQAAIADAKDKYLRLSAEFDNYRKRTLKEKAELIKNGAEKTLTAILPVLDDLERAVKTADASEETKAMREGVELIFNKFVKVLNQEGLQKIETEGQAFDTDYHEAIALIPAQSEDQKNQILDCVQTGYTLNEKVIRHAKVVVAQ